MLWIIIIGSRRTSLLTKMIWKEVESQPDLENKRKSIAGKKGKKKA